MSSYIGRKVLLPQINPDLPLIKELSLLQLNFNKSRGELRSGFFALRADELAFHFLYARILLFPGLNIAVMFPGDWQHACFRSI